MKTMESLRALRSAGAVAAARAHLCVALDWNLTRALHCLHARPLSTRFV